MRDNSVDELPAAEANAEFGRNNGGDELHAADFDLVCFCMGVISLYWFDGVTLPVVVFNEDMLGDLSPSKVMLNSLYAPMMVSVGGEKLLV